MAKAAKLVLFSPMVRVIVDEDATDEQILEAARPKLHVLISEPLFDILEDIIPDEECPYNSESDGE